MDALPDAETVLRERFGLREFRTGQREVIAALLAGKSAAAVFPTGAGKSLCYQLPALVLGGVTLVVSPLIALMKDQIDALSVRGIAARRLDSSLGGEEYREVLALARSGRLPLLFVAPERFNNERFRAAMRGVRIALFAVDEAHCISEWGHNFRPDYLKLAGYAREFGAERILALTATATPRVLEDIRRGFGIERDCAVRTGFHRENLALRFTPVTRADRDHLLLDRLRERSRGATIVYVTLQRTAEEVAAMLVAHGFPASAYHAGMEDEDRARIQDEFLAAKDGIVVATIAFGMGIDKPDIRYVYHYNLPKSLENYAQEVGRAGRDGADATCETFACTSDLRALENFVYGDTPTRAAIRGMLGEVLAPVARDSGGAGRMLSLDVRDLAFRHDVRDIVAKTLLTYLELDGFLAGGTPEFARYEFVPKRTSKEILAEYEGEAHAFLLEVLRRVVKSKKWFRADVDAIGTAIGAHRDRVVRALEELAERDWIELRADGVRHRYRLLRDAGGADDALGLDRLADALFERARARERAELARLRQVLDLVAHDTCQASALGEHFGEPLVRPCGRCSRCVESDASPQFSLGEESPEADRAVIRSALVVADEHAFLVEPLALARFLCGISSPRLARARLARHPLFGVAAEVTLAKVREAIEAERSAAGD